MIIGAFESSPFALLTSFGEFSVKLLQLIQSAVTQLLTPIFYTPYSILVMAWQPVQGVFAAFPPCVLEQSSWSH